MPSDQLLSELNDDPRTKAYRAERLAAWANLRQEHAAYRDSAEKHGSSESAAEQAADLYMRGKINLFIGEMLVHSRQMNAAAFLTEAPQGWGSRSELLVDMDNRVKHYVARTYHIQGLNVSVAPLSTAAADDPAAWRPWLEKLVGQLGAAKAVAHIFDPKATKPSPPSGIGPGKASSPPSPPSPPGPPSPPVPPGPPNQNVPAPTPTPSPAPAPQSPWRTAFTVTAGVVAGGLVVAGVRKILRR